MTFDVLEAEAHRGKGVEREFEVFAVPGAWPEAAEQSKLIASMRDFREMVKAMQDEALRWKRAHSVTRKESRELRS